MSVILACSMTSEPSFERDSDNYQKMVKSALVDTGNNHRLKTMIEIIDGLSAFMKRKGYAKLDDFKGIIQKNDK